MKQTYDVFIKCTNKIILLVAGEDVHVLQKVISEHFASPFQLNTGGIFVLLFPPQTIYIWATTFFFFFFYDSGVEYQVTRFCCCSYNTFIDRQIAREAPKTACGSAVHLLLCI